MPITQSQSKRIVKNTSWVPIIENVYSLAHDNDFYERCEVATQSGTMAKTTLWAPKIDNYFSLAN